MTFCANCGAGLPHGARFCPNCASPVAERSPSEERKLATVLFADLVGSTAVADAQDAERTRALLNRFYDGMATEIAEAGGTIEKFIGDAVVAVFGAPAAQEDQVDRALHAALAMRSRLQDLFGDTLRLRIGVNTGDVVLGQPRAGSSFVSGDAVNVAARLEQSARAGTDSGRRAHGLECAQGLRLRARDDDRSEGQDARSRLSPTPRHCCAGSRAKRTRLHRAERRAREASRLVLACSRQRRHCPRRHRRRGRHRQECARPAVPRLAFHPAADAQRTFGALPVLRAGERVRAAGRDRARTSRAARPPTCPRPVAGTTSAAGTASPGRAGASPCGLARAASGAHCCGTRRRNRRGRALGRAGAARASRRYPPPLTPPDAPAQHHARPGCARRRDDRASTCSLPATPSESSTGSRPRRSRSE